MTDAVSETSAGQEDDDNVDDEVDSRNERDDPHFADDSIVDYPSRTTKLRIRRALLVIRLTMCI